MACFGERPTTRATVQHHKLQVDHLLQARAEVVPGQVCMLYIGFFESEPSQASPDCNVSCEFHGGGSKHCKLEETAVALLVIERKKGSETKSEES